MSCPHGTAHGEQCVECDRYDDGWTPAVEIATWKARAEKAELECAAMREVLIGIRGWLSHAVEMLPDGVAKREVNAALAAADGVLGK